MKFKKTTLPNGLRVITVPVKGNPAVTVLVMVETGSNYESKAENGLSHFLEHMCFKGTSKRPDSLSISLELDNLGAENNAFTSNEMTGYWAKAEKKHYKKLLDVLSDMYLNPVFPSADLEKERGVILQEISMYEDLPQRKVWEVLDMLLYGDTPAGRTVLGPKENIKRFARKDFINYRNKHYVAGKTIVAVAGDVNEKEVVAEVKKYFKDIPKTKRINKAKVVEKQRFPGLKIHKKKTDQMHMVLAFRAFGAADRRVPALDVLTTLLGRGMSSRLFQKLRDELGACYYVRAAGQTLTDHGLLAISTGIEAKRAEEVVKVLIEEAKKLAQVPVSKEELNKAKEFHLGHLYMDLETSDSLAEFYAEQAVVDKKLKTPTEIEQEIRRVTAEEVRAVARELFRNDNLNLAVVGDIADSRKIKKVLKMV
ncbi:MAG: pitrilysin family protein [bacterium]|nr:pitrilysin family protein [bacterium]